VSYSTQLKHSFTSHDACTQLPKPGIPIRKMSASYRGASSAYTEFGPPEIMIALQTKRENYGMSEFRQ
jgi:hypothetical protein